MGGTGLLVFHRTERVFKNIFLFWVLCALEKNCTEPTTTLSCNTEKMKRGEYAGIKIYIEFYIYDSEGSIGDWSSSNLRPIVLTSKKTVRCRLKLKFVL